MSQSGLCIFVCDIFLQHLYFLTKGKYKRHAEGAKGTLARFHLLFPSTPECERSLPPAPTKAADGRCGTTGEIKNKPFLAPGFKMVTDARKHLKVNSVF